MEPAFFKIIFNTGGVRTATARPDGYKCEFAICLQVVAEVTSGAVRKNLFGEFITVLRGVEMKYLLPYMKDVTTQRNLKEC